MHSGYFSFINAFRRNQNAIKWWSFSNWLQTGYRRYPDFKTSMSKYEDNNHYQFVIEEPWYDKEEYFIITYTIQIFILRFSRRNLSYELFLRIKNLPISRVSIKYTSLTKLTNYPRHYFEISRSASLDSWLSS